MTPAEYDLDIYQGDTFERWITLTDSEDEPVPLDDWQIRAQIRSRPESSTILAEFEIEKDEEETGRFKMLLTPEATAAMRATMPGQEYAWDLEMTDSLGRVGTYLRGAVRVTAQVTR